MVKSTTSHPSMKWGHSPNLWEPAISTSIGKQRGLWRVSTVSRGAQSSVASGPRRSVRLRTLYGWRPASRGVCKGHIVCAPAPHAGVQPVAIVQLGCIRLDRRADEDLLLGPCKVGILLAVHHLGRLPQQCPR